jgi:hypothetical protein
MLQKKAIRIISKSNSNSHTAPLFLNTSILPFTLLIKYQNLKLMHSLVYEYGPKSLQSTIKKNERNLQFELRSHDLYYVPLARIELIKKCPLYYLPSIWNNSGDIIYHYNSFTFATALRDELFNTLKETTL